MFHHYVVTALRHMKQHVGTTLINLACLTFGFVVFLFAWGQTRLFEATDHYHERADRTVVLTRFQPLSRMTLHISSGVLAKHVEADFPDLEAVARVMYPQEAVLAVAGQSQFASIAYADAAFLSIFDLPFVAGDPRRALSQPRSIVISEALAIRLFGTSDALGRTLRFNATAHDVVVAGVVGSIREPSHMTLDDTGAPGMRLGFEALVSMDMNPVVDRASWDSDAYFTYAVLPRAGLDEIRAFDRELKAFTQRRVPQELHSRMIYGARPIGDFLAINMNALFRSDVTGVAGTTIFKVLGILVLAIACLNYTNLATAVAMTHTKEVALRKVVGASRWQLASQHLVESGLLSVAAIVLALLFVGLSLFATSADTLSACIEILAPSASFWSALMLTTLAVTIGASLYPVFVLSRVRPAESLRSGKLRGGPRVLATALVALQFAAASFLMIAVFIMVSQHREMRLAIWNPTSDPLLTIANDIRGAGVNPDLLAAELARQPGVAGVTGIGRAPWSLGSDSDTLSSWPDGTAQGVQATRLIIGFDFFSTLDIPMLAGRTFDRTRAADVANVSAWLQRDVGAASDFNVIIDERYRERLGFASPAAAIDQVLYRATSSDGSKPPQRLRIIGVAQQSAVLPMNLGMPVFFLMNPTAAPIPIVRIDKNDVAGALERIDSTWHAQAPDLPLRRRFADEQFELSFRSLSDLNAAFAVLAAIACAIAAMGLVGMALHVTRRRLHEIGIRKTLGARAGQIYVMLLRSFSTPVVIANVAVWPLVYALMSAYLGVFAVRSSLNATPFLSTLLASLAIACIAVSAQAWRAARLKPVEVLRLD